MLAETARGRLVESAPPDLPPPLPNDRLERVWAWGMASSALGYVYRPSTPDGIRDAFGAARARGIGVGLRGAGRSYGDAAQSAENVVLDLTRMARILDWDPSTGLVRVEPGVTIGQLWRATIEDGWWPAVVPGTMTPTVGGCASMNIHGKNHWKVGPFGDHVVAFELMLPDGTVRRCSREDDSELFHAAIGGFGMLGCFVSLTLRLKRVHSGLLEVEPIRVGGLREMFSAFEERSGRADDLVGWIDGFARGRSLGRGWVHQARELGPGDDPHPSRTLRVEAQEIPDSLAGGLVPKSMLWRLMKPWLNDPGMRLINAAKYRLGGRHRFRQSHAAFSFLLDSVPNWKWAYRPGGLIQYQSFLPAGEAEGVFRAQLELCRRRGLAPYLAVFKRHRADPFLMSYALDGYSLALDFKVTAARRPRLWSLAAELDRLVVGAGGRFYFAKDSTLSPASLRSFLAEDRVRRFLELKRECDPGQILQTDLYRRLFTAGR